MPECYQGKILNKELTTTEYLLYTSKAVYSNVEITVIFFFFLVHLFTSVLAGSADNGGRVLVLAVRFGICDGGDLK